MLASNLHMTNVHDIDKLHINIYIGINILHLQAFIAHSLHSASPFLTFTRNLHYTTYDAHLPTCQQAIRRPSAACGWRPKTLCMTSIARHFMS